MHVQKPTRKLRAQADRHNGTNGILAGILTFEKTLTEPLDCNQMLRKSLPPPNLGTPICIALKVLR